MPPEYPNGVVTKYSVHFDERNIDPFGVVVSNKMMGTVEALLPDTDYVFEMKAYTKIGSGSPFFLPVKTCKLLNNDAYM